MVADVQSGTAICKGDIFEMRHSGMPMREIAVKIGRSKERVRQILVQGCGTTNHEYLSTLQLCNLSGLPRNRIMDMYHDGVINPFTKWDAGNREYLLWQAFAVTKIRTYYKNHRLCKVCNKPLPRNRTRYCSGNCCREQHKYKHMTPEEKKRVLDNIRRYRERRKILRERPVAAMLCED